MTVLVSPGVAMRVDVLVATVGQRDVAPLQPRPAASRKPPEVHERLCPHPIFEEERPDLHRFGLRAGAWLMEDGPEEARARAKETRLPLVDPILQYLAEQGSPAPAVVLVATNQADPDFKPFDTKELAQFMKEVLERREDPRTADIQQPFEITADPSDLAAVLAAVRPVVEALQDVARKGVDPLHVGLATTGGTPALTHALTLLMAAATSGAAGVPPPLKVMELRLRPGGRVQATDLSHLQSLTDRLR